MSFGLTPEGFFIKRLQDILESVKANLHASLGNGINTDADSAIGQFVAAVGEELSEIWEAGQASYSGNYPETASGVSLDGAVSLVGLTRQPATFSTVGALLTGTDGSSIPSGSRASVEGRPDNVFETQSAVTLTRLVCAAALFQVSTVVAAFSYEVTINGGAPFAYVSTSTAYVNPTAALATDTFTITGQLVAYRFYVGRSFTVTGSTGNNGTYTVLSVIESGGNTIITVVQDVTANSSNGQINLADDAGDIAAGLVIAIDAGSDPLDSSVSGSDSVYVLADDLEVPFSIAVGTNLTLTTVSAFHEMIATLTGVVAADASSLTVIDTPVTGWLSVNNPEGAIRGRAIETDTELRLRQLQSRKAIGSGTVDAIRARVLEVEGVTACNVNENVEDVSVFETFAIIQATAGGAGLGSFKLAGDVRLLFPPTGPNATFAVANSSGNDGTYTVGSVTLSSGDTVITPVEAVPSGIDDGDMDLETLPEHSFEVVADGGDNQDIADTIWTNKPAGIETFGVSEAESANDSEGDAHDIFFSRPSELQIYCDVTVTVNAEEDPPVQEDIEDAVTAYFDALTIGGNVIVDRIAATAILSTTGVDTVVVEIGFNPSPTGTVNKAVSARQRAVLASGGLTVTIV